MNLKPKQAQRVAEAIQRTEGPVAITTGTKRGSVIVRTDECATEVGSRGASKEVQP